MKQVIVFLIFFLPTVVVGEEQRDIAAIELAESLGLEALLDSTLSQTRLSLEKQSDSMLSGITKYLPNLTEKQKHNLKLIISEYMNSILDSIDNKKASIIYTSILSENLATNEMTGAINYYNSSRGKKVLLSVSKASEGLNQYILSSIENSVVKAQSIMSDKLVQFKKDMSDQKIN